MKCLGKCDYRTDTKLEEDCIACYKAQPGDRVGGWLEFEDGKLIRKVSPDALGKTLDAYDYYCLATPMARKIGRGADWPGRTPKWCPWKEQENE